MIKQLSLKFGSSPESSSLNLQATPVTVFVGPNNSGKSKVLQEIHHFCTHGRGEQWHDLVGNIVFDTMTESDAMAEVAELLMQSKGSAAEDDNILLMRGGGATSIQKAKILELLTSEQRHIHEFCQFYLKHKAIKLTGENRTRLTNAQPAGNLKQAAQGTFQMLFRDDVKREEIRKIIYDAFGFHLVIDPTEDGHLKLRLSDRAPANATEERGLHDAAVKFHSAARPIDEASDGVKSFIGIIIEVLAGSPAILLLDEPEAFLHPALAFALGREICSATNRGNKRIFVSTHSPAFVMGCIQSGARINIVRLTYLRRIPTARLLPSDKISSLMRNPLLRSTSVLNALFYENVVVTEADSDRAFYQEINERLLRVGRGVPNCLFINAQNKQTVCSIVKPLRELGIPTVGLVDIDVIKEGGAVWKKFLEMGFVPSMDIEAWAVKRRTMHDKFKATNKDMKKEGGVALLSPEDKEAAMNLFDALAEYGLFVVPHGEVEYWLSHLEVAGHGSSWLISMFERMGDDPAADEYVGPANDDVWAFVERVKGWLSDPLRKGIPA